MTTKPLVLALLLIVFCRTVIADSSCKDRQDLVAQCFDIRGRISIYNGTPGVRIWPVGTKRLLGVLTVVDETGNEGETFAGPSNLKIWVKDNTATFADLWVCPLSEEKVGHMRMVCIESAQNLRVEKYIDFSETVEIIHVPES